MSDDAQNPVQPQQPDVQTLTQQLAEATREMQAAKKIAEEAANAAKQSHQYMEGIRKAASGETDTPKPKSHSEQFLDAVVTHGEEPIRNIVQQEFQKKAYLDTLENNFKRENPHLAPFQHEVFNMANQIINQGLQTGQRIGNEEALKQAAECYSAKTKQYGQIAGANATPNHQSFPTPDSRYQGTEKDYFAMSDKEWQNSPERRQKQQDRKSNQRRNLSHYGYGR